MEKVKHGKMREEMWRTNWEISNVRVGRVSEDLVLRRDLLWHMAPGSWVGNYHHVFSKAPFIQGNIYDLCFNHLVGPFSSAPQRGWVSGRRVQILTGYAALTVGGVSTSPELASQP